VLSKFVMAAHLHTRGHAEPRCVDGRALQCNGKHGVTSVEQGGQQIEQAQSGRRPGTNRPRKQLELGNSLRQSNHAATATVRHSKAAAAAAAPTPTLPNRKKAQENGREGPGANQKHPQKQKKSPPKAQPPPPPPGQQLQHKTPTTPKTRRTPPPKKPHAESESNAAQFLTRAPARGSIR